MTTKRKIQEIAEQSPQTFIATIADLNVIARDAKGAAKVVGPNLTVNMHGTSGLNNVELSGNLNPLELRLGDEVLVTKVHDRYIVYATMPISQRTGAPGSSFGLGARDTGGTPEPTSVTATISGKWLKIEWDAVPGASMYQVVRSANQSTTDITSEVIAETSATTYDTRYRGEDADPSMWYSVVAIDKNSRASYMSDWVQPEVQGSAEGGFYSANLTSAISGELIVAQSSNTLRTDFRTSKSPTPFIIEINDSASGHTDTQPIANGSILYTTNANGYQVYAKVISAKNKDSYWAYTCTKVFPTGNTNRTVKAGSTIINYGVSGKGYLYFTADHTNAPFISVRTHTADSGSYPVATAPLELVRMGNLNGNWGYVANTFGFAVGEYASNKPNITLDTTNGLRIRNYTTNVLTLDTSGNAAFTGSITATTGTIGGWTIGSTSLVAGSGSTTVGLDSGGTNPAFYAGSSTPTSAPAQIYNSGYAYFQDVVLAKGVMSGSGNASGYGYAVSEPYLLCHFDGPLPYESDYQGSAIGHRGQPETRAGGVIFRKGIFGKAVQLAVATTNYVLNPSAETTSNFVARGTATVTRDTATYYIGATSYKVVLAAANDGVDLTLSALANAIHYVSFRVTGDAISTLQVSLDGTNWNAITQILTETLGSNTWTYCGVQIAAAQANGSTTCRIRNTASSGTFYIDAAQVEQKTYPSPYCDGGLGGSTDTTVKNGHSWSGTAHASTSSRVATTLTYSATSNINLSAGSISFWYRNTGLGAAGTYAFGARIDANNWFGIQIVGNAGTVRPLGTSSSGGSGVDTSSGATIPAVGWHHVVVTWTTGSMKCYLDGAQTGATATYVVPVGTLSTIEIGAFNSAGQANVPIDDFCILPYVLTLNEVKSIYYSSAPLVVSVASQEFRLSGTGLGDVFGNANGLFGRASDGTPSFGILNGTVNATTWGGASESFDSGDFMFGSNASGKGNLIFDASTGTLALRTATTKKISLDTNGTLLIGSNVAAVSTNAFAIFSGAVSYNGETMVAGDILIGDNSTNVFNILISNSASSIYFRNDTTVETTISSSGIVTSNLILSGILAINRSTTTVGSGTIDLNIDSAAATNSKMYITSSSGNFTVRGITTPSDDGFVLFLINDTSNNMTLQASGSPGAGYSKITTFGSGSPATTAAGCAILVYDLSNDRWDLFAIYG